MKAGIYSRKSKFTATGASTKNQIDLCKEYARKYFNILDFIIYEDEGFSGSNTHRPEYQKMIQDAQNKKFKVLICYRLDRISRNVLDFSKTIQMLQKNHISFVSIREQFDTSTPMGRAMMYIASVFAQLERETIAERIKDNMQKLALTGRWLGGKCPFGFNSKQIQMIDYEGTQKKLYQLIPIPEKLHMVQLIYDKYLQLRSFTKVAQYLMNHQIKKDTTLFTLSTLHYILTNPVYCIADTRSYQYFIGHKAKMTSKDCFDGIHGLLAYAKHDEKIFKLQDKKNWFLGVGKHKGIISSKHWIQVQNIIKSNQNKAIKNGSSNISFITPLLKCQCGETMKACSVQKDQEGNIKYYYYVCRQKERTHKHLCNIKNLNGFKTDKMILNALQKIKIDPIVLENLIAQKFNTFCMDNTNFKNIKSSILKDLENKKKAIHKLINSIMNSQNTGAYKYIVEKINLIHEEIKILEVQLNQFNEHMQTSSFKEIDTDILDSFIIKSMSLDSYTFKEKQQLIHNLINKIIWDGTNLNLYFKDLDFTNHPI